MDVTYSNVSRLNIVMSNSLHEKFEKLNLEGDMCGLIDTSTYPLTKYVIENENHTKQTTVSIIYEVKTTSEDIYIRQHRQNINRDLLRNIITGSLSATHVVVGIEWGGTCVITAVLKNTRIKDEATVKTELHTQMNKLKVLLENDINITTTECEEHDIEFIVSSDAMNFSNKSPTTFIDIVDYTKCFLVLAAFLNRDKGLALTFHLYPIELRIKMCNIDNSSAAIRFQPLLSENVHKCVSHIEKLHDTQKEINKMYEDFTSHLECISSNEVTTINNLHQDNIQLEEQFKDTLKTLVTEVRCKQLPDTDIHSFFIL